MVELTDNFAWNNQYSHSNADNCSELLRKADVLKKKITTSNENLDYKEIGDKLADRITLQDLYRKLLISNLEYALDKKIEQDLWNVVFKNHITSLQQKAKDKTNAKRSDAQNQLTIFLEAASGFYAQLLQDLCQIFHLVVPCRVPVSQFSISSGVQGKQTSVISQPERPSCQYMCQHCLVHLGDIARYRNQSGQAESYYRHAAQLVPSNGQPYNQLAILAAASGDVLSMSFYYCRSLAVKCPFPASSTNLKRQLSKIMDSSEPRHTKISISELIKYFLKFHACIYLKKHDEKLEQMRDKLISYLQLHLRAGSLNQQHLVHITFLNLFSLSHRSLSLSTSPVADNQLVDQDSNNGLSLEQTTLSWRVLLAFTLQLMDLFLACVPVYSEVDEDLNHIVMPAIKLTLNWLLTQTGIIDMDEMLTYPRLWNNLAALLNALKTHAIVEDYSNLPLPEDLELRGFIALKEAFSEWNFSKGCESVVDITLQHKFRGHRLLRLGSLICERNKQLLIQEEDSLMFECPLEFTNTSPITVEDFQIDNHDSPVDTSANNNRLKVSKQPEVKIVRKQTNSTHVIDIKLNAIKEEDNGQGSDLKKKDESESTKTTHHVTFKIPDKHESLSPKFGSTSPEMWQPSKPTTLDHTVLQDFNNFRNGLASPVHTPEERDYTIDNMSKHSPGFPSYPFVANTRHLPSAQYRYPIIHHTSIRHQTQQPNLQDILVPPFALQHSAVPNTQTIPILIPNQSDNIQQQMAQIQHSQAQLQRAKANQKKIDPMSRNFSSLLAPTFSSVHAPAPVNMINVSSSHSFSSDKIPSSWKTGASQLQQNLRNMQQTTEGSFTRGPMDMRSNMMKPHHNSEEYGHQFMYNYPLIGQSPDSSNNTSSTPSPTPGVKLISKTSPQAGTRGQPLPGFGDFPIAKYDLDRQEANDVLIRAMLNKMNKGDIPVRSIPLNDKEFSDKPCRDDNNMPDIFDTPHGPMPVFEKQPPYQLFPESDSAWSIGQGNNQNHNKLGSIGSERAFAHQQQLTNPPPPSPQFSPWSDNYQFRSQDFQKPPVPKEQSFNTPDAAESLWSPQLNSLGPSALEQLILQQQEHMNLHKPPP